MIGAGICYSLTYEQFRISNRSPSLLVFLGDALKPYNRRRAPLLHQLLVHVSHSSVSIIIAIRCAESRTAHMLGGSGGGGGVKRPPIFSAAGLPQNGATRSGTSFVSNNSVTRSNPVKLRVSLKTGGVFRRSMCWAGQAGWGTSSPAVEIATKCKHEGCCCCCRWCVASEDAPPHPCCCCVCYAPPGGYE